MKKAGQPTGETGSRAGFYLRTRKRTWFWGWGSPPPAAAKQPWAGVGEWLRRLRAQTALAGRDNDVVCQAIQNGQPAAEAVPLVPSGNQRPVRERKLRFVCDRHFIGFVLS